MPVKLKEGKGVGREGRFLLVSKTVVLNVLMAMNPFPAKMYAQMKFCI